MKFFKGSQRWRWQVETEIKVLIRICSVAGRPIGSGPSRASRELTLVDARDLATSRSCASGIVVQFKDVFNDNRGDAIFEGLYKKRSATWSITTRMENLLPKDEQGGVNSDRFFVLWFLYVRCCES